MPGKNEVMKALSQDDLTILSNIKSAIDELMQMSGQGPQKAEDDMVQEPEQPEAPQDETPVEMGDEAPEQVTDDKPKPMKAKKAEVTTPSDVATPDTASAQDMIDEPMTEETEEQLNEVARTFVNLLQNVAKGKVKKSAPVHPLVQVAKGQSDGLALVNQKVDKMANVLEAFVDAFGVTEQINIAQKASIPERNRTPILNPDSGDVVKFLSDALSQVQKSKG